MAHIDATPDDLVRQVKRRHGLDAKDLLDGRIQYITIWKPLRGPLHDYPLALCDKQSVDDEKDFEPQDIVDRDEVLENVHVYHRKRHAWCYLGGQEDTELLIFRQADTLQKGFGKFSSSCDSELLLMTILLARYSSLRHLQSCRSTGRVPEGEH